jgi:drug/metabolite transporter (DMT)-like permease
MGMRDDRRFSDRGRAAASAATGTGRASLPFPDSAPYNPPVTLPAAVWLILGTIWGSTWLFIKIGLEDLPPVSFAAVRFVVAPLPLLIWLVIRRRVASSIPSSRDPVIRSTWARDWRPMVVTGLLTFAVNYPLVFWGESYIPAGLTAILYTTFPIIGMLLAHWLLPDEPLSGRKLAGALIAFAGVVVIFQNQVAVRGMMAMLGSGAIVLAAGCTAYADVVVKRDCAHIDPIKLTTVQMLVSVGPMLVLGIALDGNPFALHWTTRAVVSLLYLALLGSALTFTLLYWLIQRTPVTRAMFIPFMSTAIAVVLDAIVLGERMHWRTFAGGTAILGGVALALVPHAPDAARRDSQRQ